MSEEQEIYEELDEEYAARIQQEVQHIQREESEGEDEREVDDEEREEYYAEADDDDDGDYEDDDDEGDEEPARPSIFWLVLSGNVLLARSLTKYYGQMVAVAALFLLSIVVMFWSLHLDMQYNVLGREVQLLRERSVRLQELRYSRSSHSAIVKELERRGIDLVDPKEPATIIDNGLW